MTQDEVHAEIYRRIDEAIERVMRFIDREEIFQTALLHHKTTGEIPNIEVKFEGSRYIKTD